MTTLRTLRPALGLVLGCLLLLGACDGTGHSPCTLLKGRLVACDLIGPGFLPCELEAISAYDRCTAGCVHQASCADLQQGLCGEEDPPALSACLDGCLANWGFACDDGAEVFGAHVRCDGQADCQDGTDEQGCETFGCADGSQTVPAWAVCDAVADCADGSDEADCPADAFFPCADGSGEIPTGLRCDGEPDCPDGSDEQGCAAPICD